MPYTQQTRTADVARTFDGDPSMVTQARAVVARASCTSDNNFMDATGKEFERNPLDTFAVSLATDATQETLTLNLSPFIDPSIARSTGTVLVSSHRIGCQRWATTLLHCWRASTRPSQVVYKFRSCWVEVRVAVVRPFRCGRPWRELRGGGRKEGHARFPGTSCRSGTAGITRRVCAKHAWTAQRKTHWMSLRSTFFQTSGLFFRLEKVGRYVDAPTCNLSPNSEGEELRHQKIRV